MNGVCSGFFWIYAFVWLVILVLTIEYFIVKSAETKRSRQKQRPTNSFTKILIFVFIWTFSLTFYFTEAFINYGFKLQIWITSVPIFFTFLIVAVVIQNLLQILNQLRGLGRYNFLTSLKIFKYCAIFCVATQVINPLFAMLEKGTPESKLEQGKYEDNAWYYSRNVLTSLAIFVLSVYTVNTGYYVAEELQKHEEFKRDVRVRVIVLCSLIEVVLLLRLAMIWSANHFWYGQSQIGWPLFVTFYQVFANMLPLLGFLIVLV
jgi:hypothetical protein